jgi:hypothetical protein
MAFTRKRGEPVDDRADEEDQERRMRLLKIVIQEIDAGKAPRGS